MASINKLLSKINQATSAINSVKGIKSKIQGKGYLANVDKLVEQAEEAKRKLDKRRESLQKNQDATNKAKSLRVAKQPPKAQTIELKYPLDEELYNYLEFNIRPRRNRGTKNGKNLLSDKQTDILLYVPNGISNDAKVSYSAKGVGVAARSLIGRNTGAIGEGGENVGMSMKDNAFFDGLNAIVSSGLNSLANKMTGDLVNFTQGQAVNPMKEQMLEGVEFRSFNFNFSFYPRSKKEAARVNDIIWNFKTAMLPDTFGSDESSADVENYFNYPNIVDIKWNGDIAKTMDGFLPCVITDCNVKYGEKFATFEDGQPVSVTMDLGVTEIKILTQETYQQIAASGTSDRISPPEDIGEGQISLLDTNRTGG